MPRYKLLIEYDGSPFKGWQSQANGPSVQDALEAAVVAFSGERVRLTAAGRTDTGVHATGQVAHLDLERDWPERTVREAINARLVPQPVSVLAAERVGEEFNARFSATGRRYLYRILNRPGPPALLRGQVWHLRRELNAEAMQRAAQALVGLHDFTTFRDAQCQSASPVKTLDEAWVERVGEEVRLHFAARSFLHRQVRSMTGTLVEVGAGRWPEARVAEALAAADRSRCGPVAPPQGLYLTDVAYASGEEAVDHAAVDLLEGEDVGD
jgi:tRNA pseudouridine38-40 synthase